MFTSCCAGKVCLDFVLAMAMAKLISDVFKESRLASSRDFLKLKEALHPSVTELHWLQNQVPNAGTGNWLDAGRHTPQLACRERAFYIFSQPTRLYRCARVVSNLVKNNVA